MADIKKHWSFLDKAKLKTDPKNAQKIFGSIMAMLDENIVLKGKLTNYNSLRNAIKDTRFLNTDKYLINECEFIQKKHKK